MRLRARAAALLVVATFAGCDSQSPLAQNEASPTETSTSMTSILEGSFHASAVVRCVVTVATEVVTCTSPQDPDPNAPPPLGGYGNHVRIGVGAVKNVPDSLYFRMRTRVQNLMPQVIGSHSGAITGLRAFFHGLPVTTGGTGTVTVANPDGVAEFTAVGQPYFQYEEKVASLAGSLYEWWRFNVPATVTAFRFDIYVSMNIMPLLVFDMEVEGNRDIYAVNADRTGLRRLTTSPAVDMTPTAAFERAVFVSYRDGNAELYSVSLNGGAQTRLTVTGANETQPALSRDNTKLAFVSDVNGMPRIMVSNANGTGAVGISSFGHGASIESSPAWLVGTTQLVYASTGGSNLSDLFSTVLSTGVVTRLINPARSRYSPAVSPDGSQVVHALATTDATNSEIWIYDRNAVSVTKFTARNPPDRKPTFLHDGRIAWEYGLINGSYKLRWTWPDGSGGRTFSVAGGKPANPFGVPLRP